MSFVVDDAKKTVYVVAVKWVGRSVAGTERQRRTTRNQSGGPADGCQDAGRFGHGGEQEAMALPVDCTRPSNEAGV